jgi:pimeloyl-ACP methyl ester carboxylesterase
MTPKRLAYRTLATGINTLTRFSPKLAGRLAFRLFATPPPPRIREKEQRFVDRADRLDRRILEWEVPVYAWGPTDGPIAFCAYGWGYNAGRWRHYVPALVEAGYRVVAFDPPGHGHATGPRVLDYPTMAEIMTELMRSFGGIDLVLAHSFGGSCLVESLRRLPPTERPVRICLLAIVSEVRWLFVGFADFMGFSDRTFRALVLHIQQRTGRRLDEFDVTIPAAELTDIPTLLVHDPRDATTAYRHAQRNHSHWPGSLLYSPEGAGHHLGTPEVTKVILRFLIRGARPAGAILNRGQIEPLPAVVDARDIATSGVTDFYA